MGKINGKERIVIENENGGVLDRLQTFGIYDTTSYQNLSGTVSGAVSSSLSADVLYRIKAYTSDCWVKIESNPSPATEEGMLMTQYDEITLEVNDGDKIGVIGGDLNIVPLS